MKRPLGYCLLFLSVIFLGVLVTPVKAQETIEAPDVVLEVDGLSCPFCAFGIEKKLKKIKNVEQIAVHLEEGKVEIKLKEGTTLSEERLREAVADAGFAPRSITFVNEKARAPASSGSSG